MQLYEFYNKIKSQNILFSFKGRISQQILVELGEFLKGHISMDKKIKKIFSIFIEMAQNIMYYSAERSFDNDEEIGIGILIFTEDSSGYKLYSGNLISNSSVPKLSSHIDLVNKLNPEELKLEYNRRRKIDPDIESKGAGLGFIEIARKSNTPIVYNIDLIDGKHSFLELSVGVKKEEIVNG